MNSKKVFSNFIWRLAERCGAQGVSFVVSVVLARILDTEVYGTVALVTVFTAILQVFVDSGFGVALIQKKDADDLDFSTVFYFNIVSCLVLYGLIFLAAPGIARFYHNESLVKIIRVLSLLVVISGVKSIQISYVSRNMIFKRFFWATLGGTVGAAIVGIWMALKGYGVWALVAQNLFNQTVDTLILWITVKWRPKKQFSFQRLKELFSYGWKLLASSLLETVYTKLRALIIGKVYSSEDLAFYDKGGHLPELVIMNISSSIDSVLLPSLSAEQERAERVKAMTRRAIMVSTYLIMPMMMGLAVCATPLIRLILTEKWLPCVFFLRIFCFTYAFYPVHTANLNAIKAMGRSDSYLILEIIKKCVGLVALVSTMFISVKAMAYSMLVTTVISQIINSWPNKKLLNYSYPEQVRDMLPQIAVSCIMGAVVYCVTFLNLPDFPTLLIQIPLGVVVYFLISKLLKLESYTYILSMAKGYLQKAHGPVQN